MENFPYVVSICRTALQNPTAALKRHIERLASTLEKQGETEQATALSRLLSSAEHGGSIGPSRVVLSRQSLSGEVMSRSVQAPVDRETGAALAELQFPSLEPDENPPILNESLQGAVDHLVNEWLHLDKLKAAGVRPPLNCLIFGAPGTGKTRLAQVISSKLSLPLVTARLDGLISSFLGTTARNIAMLFDFANRYQCVLLLDEFDAVAKIRDDPHEVGEIKRVVNTLLQCLDTRSNIGFTIAITNHESLLDAAVWRRFDTRIFVPKPNAESRKRIVDKYMVGANVDAVESDFIAWLTDGYSGAEIETICDALKRYYVISGRDDVSVIDVLRQNIYLSAHHVKSLRKDLFLADQEVLAQALSDDISFSFRLEELARLFRKDKSTISRWLKRAKRVEHEQ